MLTLAAGSSEQESLILNEIIENKFYSQIE